MGWEPITPENFGVTLILLETCKSLAGQLAKEEGLGSGLGGRSPGSVLGFVMSF